MSHFRESQQTVKYDAVMLFWRTITQIFFREVRPRGAFNIPRDGPVIFVGAPHNNQFLDPLLLSLEVYRETGRHVQFLAAAKSMERKAVGFFARLMDSIPVSRAADSAKPGTGVVWISPDDPCLVCGEGTRFTEEFSSRMQIMLPKSVNSAVAEVTEVLSDTELRIKREFGGESGKGTARIREKVSELRQEGKKGLEFKKLPFVDQGEMYRHVYQCLKQGGSIGIFPEGGSHDRTDLLPLKAGVSIMALGAMANDPTVRVKIVPVGLSYFHAHRFRSRAVVEYGAALDVPDEYVEMFRQGGAQKREAVAKFLDLIYDSLKTVTIRAPDYDTLMLIQAVRRLYKTPGQHLTLGQVVELNKRLLEGYTHFKDEPRVQKLRADVLKYNRLVRDLGLRDHQVPRAQKASWKTLGLLVYQALAASVVKIAGRDVLATWKVLIALGVTPVLYTLYAILATVVAIRAKAPLKWSVWTPFLVLFALPFMNYAALKFGEAGMDVLKSLPPLIVALIPGQQRSLDKLKAMRVHLSNEVASLINDFGPRLYEDFNGKRILVPSASVPPSSGTPGLWRRKSSTGAVDAQGLGLTHPMTWIDERLFGWSRSAKRGTSAWGGLSGDETSRIGTPDETDEEDTGDYDNVVGIIASDGHTLTAHKSRSRQSSYADLQKLRMSAAPPQESSSNSKASTVVGDTQLHLRQTHRTRRASLSDGVPVTRIAAVDREEPFNEATDDLNAEVQQKHKDASL
ncbi:glycerol-3-phosphate O-acyltransferase [Crucibulum laeve]|uniref:Glycerol-3-phosphate O-acyltransferase n=1 Tax=Crucibulum laeve TaxID=68775 RepID=A0A5C3MBB5_9AGAR|nr:glycerol-3-phosphate O-acyltransferase [Crucibulum laeve]